MGQRGEDTEVTNVKSKIVIVGDCGCGKTSLINRYIHKTYTETYTPTGFDTYTATYNVSDTYKIQMSIWDTSGSAGYDRVRPLSYADADLVVICFSVGDPETFENVIPKWYREVREHCPTQPIILVGCKTDLRTDPNNIATLAKKKMISISYDQGLKAAKNIGALVYSETSTKTSHRSVTDVIEVAALSSAGKNTDESPPFRRKRSFNRRKRFSGIGEAKLHFRKEAAKSCAVM